MARESTNLKLKLYNAVTDAKELAINWFNDIFDYSNSNWVKIDEAYKEIKDNSIKDISFANNNISFTKGDDTSTTLSNNIITDKDFATQEKAGIVFPGVGTSVDDTGIISVTTDKTFTKSNLPADAKATGDALADKSPTNHTHNLSTLINALSTGTSTPKDEDYFISQFAGGGTTTTTYHRRPISALWSYIKIKTDDVYLKLAGGTITGKVHIKGSANSKPFQVRAIVGSDTDGVTDGDLHLQYGSNYPIKLGTTASYTISADGGTYTGTATTATKLSASAGSATQPVYFSDGKPVKCTYTLGKSVPSNAVFTDTTYSAATQSAAGLMSAADKKKLDGIVQPPYSITFDHYYTGTGSQGSASSPIKIQLSKSYDAIAFVDDSTLKRVANIARIAISSIGNKNYLYLKNLPTTFTTYEKVSNFFAVIEGTVGRTSSNANVRYSNNLLELYTNSSTASYEIWNRSNYRYYVFGINFNI